MNRTTQEQADTSTVLDDYRSTVQLGEGGFVTDTEWEQSWDWSQDTNIQFFQSYSRLPIYGWDELKSK